MRKKLKLSLVFSYHFITCITKVDYQGIVSDLRKWQSPSVIKSENILM